MVTWLTLGAAIAVGAAVLVAAAVIGVRSMRHFVRSFWPHN